MQVACREEGNQPWRKAPHLADQSGAFRGKKDGGGKEDESKIFGRASEEFLKIRREGEELQQELMQMKTRREEERLQEVTWARHIEKDEEEDQNEESAVRAQRRPSFFFRVCQNPNAAACEKNAIAKEYSGNAFREYCWKHEKGRGNHSAPMFEFGVCSGSREHKGKLEASAASGELLRQLQVVRDQRCN